MRKVPVVPIVILLLGGCASAPPAATPIVPVTSTSAPKPPPPRVSLICHPGTTAARFDEMGVPGGEIPLDVALSGEATYVLFAPGRVLRITRKEGKFQAQMALGKPGETWSSLTIDPADGSLWLVSESDLALRNISPSWKTKTVKLQKVEGDGGFSRILAAPDALYVTPTSSENGVWRISRDGKVLGTEFPVPPRVTDASEPLTPEELSSGPIRLERDEAGHILAWNPRLQTMHRVDPEGHWAPADNALIAEVLGPANLTVVTVLDAGTRKERWYLSGLPRTLFYWKGQPVFLGPIAFSQTGKNDTLLLLPKAGGVHEVLETCYGASIAGIAANQERYVAYTGTAVIFGDFAGAPDLP